MTNPTISIIPLGGSPTQIIQSSPKIQPCRQVLHPDALSLCSALDASGNAGRNGTAVAVALAALADWTMAWAKRRGERK